MYERYHFGIDEIVILDCVDAIRGGKERRLNRIIEIEVGSRIWLIQVVSC